MKLHEYQAKEILKSFGMPLPGGAPLFSVTDVPTVMSQLPPGPWVVKAQVHTGGRGKAGGILRAANAEEITKAAKTLFGKTLVTHQTGPAGIVIHKLYVEKGYPGLRELYLACVLDRAKGCPVIMASAEGGMDIEELAKTKPESIIYVTVDPISGLEGFRARNLAKQLGLKGGEIAAFASVAVTLAQVFLKWDAAMIEINPLGVTPEGKMIVMDTKMTLDDNALFRHPEAQAWRDPSEENPLDVRAAEAGVNYVALDGTIGCMVNGAGLAMGTMDLIKFHGGEPANFLDVGGGAKTEQVTEAFRIILSDAKVKGILVNIFGGIMKCDVIANGIVEAAKQVGMKIPLVVRLEGTNVKEGRQILKDSGLKLEAADNLTDAAEKIVKATR